MLSLELIDQRQVKHEFALPVLVFAAPDISETEILASALHTTHQHKHTFVNVRPDKLQSASMSSATHAVTIRHHNMANAAHYY
eukprot:16590-Heterococcus_DN1.PRE.4